MIAALMLAGAVGAVLGAAVVWPIAFRIGRLDGIVLERRRTLHAALDRQGDVHTTLVARRN